MMTLNGWLITLLGNILILSKAADRTSRNGTYIWVDQSRNYFAAQRLCTNIFGTTLASIHSQEQQDEVDDLMRSIHGSWPYTSAWIGLTDVYFEGHHIWLDGQPLNYTSAPLPDVDDERDCFYWQNTYTEWQQEYCTYEMQLICNLKPEWTVPMDFSFVPPLTPYNITPDGLYISYDFAATFFEADTYCQRMHGTHLATITNDEDALSALNLCSDITNNNEYCWIGLSRVYAANGWQWIDDTFNSQYYRWMSNPDMNNDCVVIDGSISSVYSWGTYGCTSSVDAFICNMVTTASPTRFPTESPSNNPTNTPTNTPTLQPSSTPTKSPTTNPSNNPTLQPSAVPTRSPSPAPTNTPTAAPSNSPSDSPSFAPTESPYKMIDVFGSHLCSQFVPNMDLLYGVSYKQCVSECIYNYGETCIMINYVGDSNPVRCYIFDKQCAIYDDGNSNNYVAFLGYKNFCIDYPSDWTDKLGDSCHAYSNVLNVCNNGDITNQTTISEIQSNANLASTFNGMQTCCDCGGGIDVVDGVKITYSNKFDNEKLLCLWDYGNPLDDDKKYRRWNNINLYDLCTKLTDKLFLVDLDCNIFVEKLYSGTINFMLCDFIGYIPNNVNVYFVFVAVRHDITSTNTIYINSDWFDLDSSLLLDTLQPSTYNSCKTSIESATSSSVYGVFPCDTHIPSKYPTFDPSIDPTKFPTTNPSMQPTYAPITDATPIPTTIPTAIPTANPTRSPSQYPSVHPTIYPTTSPTNDPSNTPTDTPSITSTFSSTAKLTEAISQRSESNSSISDGIVTILIVSAIVIFLVILLIVAIIYIVNSLKKEMSNDRQHTIKQIEFVSSRIETVLTPNPTPTAPPEEEEEEKKEESENLANYCIICASNQINMFNYPCGHSCFCMNCADQALQNDNHCPNCRQIVTECKQIYVAGFRE